MFAVHPLMCLLAMLVCVAVTAGLPIITIVDDVALGWHTWDYHTFFGVLLRCICGLSMNTCDWCQCGLSSLITSNTGSVPG